MTEQLKESEKDTYTEITEMQLRTRKLVEEEYESVDRLLKIKLESAIHSIFKIKTGETLAISKDLLDVIPLTNLAVAMVDFMLQDSRNKIAMKSMAGGVAPDLTDKPFDIKDIPART